MSKKIVHDREKSADLVGIALLHNKKVIVEVHPSIYHFIYITVLSGATFQIGPFSLLPSFTIFPFPITFPCLLTATMWPQYSRLII